MMDVTDNGVCVSLGWTCKILSTCTKVERKVFVCVCVECRGHICTQIDVCVCAYTGADDVAYTDPASQTDGDIVAHVCTHVCIYT